MGRRLQSLPICTSAGLLLREDLVESRPNLTCMCGLMRPDPAGVADDEETGQKHAWCSHSSMHQCSHLLLNDFYQQVVTKHSLPECCYQKVAIKKLLPKSCCALLCIYIESCGARHKSPHLKALESDLDWLSRSVILMQLYCSQATHVACLPIMQLKQDSCQPVLCGLLAAVSEGSQACLSGYTSL